MPAAPPITTAEPQSSERTTLPIGRMTVGEDGTVFANASRFKARMIVEAYKAGVSPQEYASPEMYGHAVTEADVHAVIAWYLQNRDGGWHWWGPNSTLPLPGATGSASAYDSRSSLTLRTPRASPRHWRSQWHPKGREALTGLQGGVGRVAGAGRLSDRPPPGPAP